MEWIWETVWARNTLIIFIVLFSLTLVAFVLAAFESEHYLNSPFRGGKKISFKKALKNYMFGLYIVVAIIAASYFGVLDLFEKLDNQTTVILICVAVPVLSVITAFLNSRNEKYMFQKIKEFIEGFLTTFTLLTVVLGGIGYYITYFM